MTREVAIGLTAAGWLALDQLTKTWALAELMFGVPVPVLPPFFQLTLVKNPGVAFGFMAQAGGFIVAIAATGAVLLLAASLRRDPSGLAHQPVVPTALGLILGGAIGNLIDRLRFGGVIDFLDFRVWPVFNVADSGITIGALLMIWAWWRLRD